jgi:hypothetical protein
VPNADTTSGTRTWRADFEIETSVGSGVYATATQPNGTPISGVTFPFPIPSLGAINTNVALGAEPSNYYGSYAGRAYRARLVYPATGTHRLETAWVNGAAVFPPEWPLATTPNDLDSTVDNGAVTVNPGTWFHDFDMTFGATVEGYVSTGYSGVCLEIRVVRTAGGPALADWGGLFDVGIGTIGGEYPMFTRGVATSYTATAYIRVGTDPSAITNTFQTGIGGFAEVLTGVRSTGIVVASGSGT